MFGHFTPTSVINPDNLNTLLKKGQSSVAATAYHELASPLSLYVEYLIYSASFNSGISTAGVSHFNQFTTCIVKCNHIYTQKMKSAVISHWFLAWSVYNLSFGSRNNETSAEEFGWKWCPSETLLFYHQKDYRWRCSRIS